MVESMANSKTSLPLELMDTDRLIADYEQEIAQLSPISTPQAENTSMELSMTLETASKILGYQPQETPEGKDITNLENRLWDLKNLAAIGVVPYTNDSVEAYKDYHVRNLTRTRRTMATVVAHIPLLATLVCLLCSQHAAVNERYFATVAYCCLAILPLIVQIIFWAKGVRGRIAEKRDFRWFDRKISQYHKSGSIPSEAILIGAKIKQAYGGTIVVHTCEEVNQAGWAVNEEKIYDPFLVWTSPTGRNYYVYHWDEPNYEPKYDTE